MDLKGSQVRSFQRAGKTVKPLWVAIQSREGYGWMRHSKDGTGFNGTFFPWAVLCTCCAVNVGLESEQRGDICL